MASSFVDVLMQRYADTQFDKYPFEVFVLGGLSPKSSGKIAIDTIKLKHKLKKRLRNHQDPLKYFKIIIIKHHQEC